MRNSVQFLSRLRCTERLGRYHGAEIALKSLVVHTRDSEIATQNSANTELSFAQPESLDSARIRWPSFVFCIPSGQYPLPILLLYRVCVFLPSIYTTCRTTWKRLKSRVLQTTIHISARRSSVPGSITYVHLKDHVTFNSPASSVHVCGLSAYSERWRSPLAEMLDFSTN